jgi:hypothetical protein
MSEVGISSLLSSICGQDMSTDTMTRGTRNRRLTVPVEFSPLETYILDDDGFVTRVDKVDNDPLGLPHGTDVPHDGFG